MRTLTIELDDEAFEMLSASAAKSGKTMEFLASLPVDAMARQDGHVVWDVEFEPARSHRANFRRGDVAQCVETGATGMVVDATATRVRISTTHRVQGAFAPGHQVAGPDQHVVVASAEPVEDLRVFDWQILNLPEYGCFASPAQNISGG